MAVPPECDPNRGPLVHTSVDEDSQPSTSERMTTPCRMYCMFSSLDDFEVTYLADTVIDNRPLAPRVCQHGSVGG